MIRRTSDDLKEIKNCYMRIVIIYKEDRGNVNSKTNKNRQWKKTQYLSSNYGILFLHFTSPKKEKLPSLTSTLYIYVPLYILRFASRLWEEVLVYAHGWRQKTHFFGLFPNQLTLSKKKNGLPLPCSMAAVRLTTILGGH